MLNSYKYQLQQGKPLLKILKNNIKLKSNNFFSYINKDNIYLKDLIKHIHQIYIILCPYVKENISIEKLQCESYKFIKNKYNSKIHNNLDLKKKLIHLIASDYQSIENNINYLIINNIFFPSNEYEKQIAKITLREISILRRIDKNICIESSPYEKNKISIDTTNKNSSISSNNREHKYSDDNTTFDINKNTIPLISTATQTKNKVKAFNIKSTQTDNLLEKVNFSCQFPEQKIKQKRVSFKNEEEDDLQVIRFYYTDEPIYKNDFLEEDKKSKEHKKNSKKAKSLNDIEHFHKPIKYIDHTYIQKDRPRSLTMSYPSTTRKRSDEISINKNDVIKFKIDHEIIPKRKINPNRPPKLPPRPKIRASIKPTLLELEILKRQNSLFISREPQRKRSTTLTIHR